MTADVLTDPEKTIGAYWVLREGDRVLFNITDPDVDEDAVKEWSKIVEAKWPDVPCVFVMGGVEVTVIGPPPA